MLVPLGPAQFASGIWTGIEFDQPIGKNDGSVDGVQYFMCPPNHGMFAPINKISKLDHDDHYDDLMNMNLSSSAMRHSGSMPKCRYNSLSGINMSVVQSKVDTGLRSYNRYSEASGLLSSSSSSVNSEDIHIGSRVFLADKKSGVVRFIGMTQFANGIWYGVELSRPVGKNNGSVQGVRYFNCPDNYGVFVQFARIIRVLPAMNARKTRSSFHSQDESDETSSDISINASGTSSLDISYNKSPPIKRMSSLVSNHSTKSAFQAPNVPASSLRRTMSLRRSFSVNQPNRMMMGNNPRTGNACSNDNSVLKIGGNVFVNGMMGILRFVGPVKFAEGTFLGIELRTAKGKNDGSIDGHRYFTCK